QLKQLLHRGGDAALVPLGDEAASAPDGLGLVAEEARRVYVALELGRRRGGVVLRRAVLAEEVGGDEVDALVRALRGEDCGDEEFERVRVVQAATRVRVFFFEKADDPARALLPFGGCFQFLPHA